MRRSKAFTLIELLIVVAVMALLASLTFAILGAVKGNMIRTRARAGLAAMETAIQAYYDKFGHYPPDNGGLYSINQLYYELVGTTNIPGPPAYFQTLNGSERMLVADVSAIFDNVYGFVNCSKPGNADQAPSGTTFLTDLKANQFFVAMVHGKNCTVLGLALDGPQPLLGANGQNINPWCYNSANPRHNPKSFDLWIDVLVAGKVNRICNWSDTPLVGATPY